MNENPLLKSLYEQNQIINSSLVWTQEQIQRVLDEIEELEYVNSQYVIADFEEKMGEKLKELNTFLQKIEQNIMEANKFEEKMKAFLI